MLRVAAAAAVVAAGYGGYRLWRFVWPGGTVRNTLKYGGQLVADVLHAHGVRTLFTLVGGHISPILVASKARGIDVVDVRDEADAVFAADAVARLTGVPGVAVVTAGPGVTNTVTAMRNAHMAQTPLVVIGGAAATFARGRGSLQDVEQLALMAPVSKAVFGIERVCDIIPTLRRAFQTAQSGVPGPVFVEIPLDVLYPMHEVAVAMGQLERKRRKNVTPNDYARVVVPEESPRSDGRHDPATVYLESLPDDASVFLRRERPSTGVTSWWFQRALKSIFGGGFDKRADVSPLPVSIPLPRSCDVSAVAALLAKSHKPVALVSSAAVSSPSRVAAVASAVASLGVPTFLSGMARGLLGRDSPYLVRQNRKAALRGADVILLIGAVVDFRLDYGRLFPRGARVISVQRSASGATLNEGAVLGLWAAARVVVADPGEFACALADRLTSSGSIQKWDEWAASLRTGDASVEASDRDAATADAFGREKDQSGNPVRLVNPLALVAAIEEVMPDNAIIICDGGDFIGTASYFVRPRGPLQWLDPGVFGTLGVGGGFALGARIARPDAEVWLLWGDGSVGFSCSELESISRHAGAPVIAVVGNDGCWAQIEREQVPMLGDSVACHLSYTAYDAVSVGFGGDGVCVHDPSVDLVETLNAARDLASQGRPVVVNVHIGKSSFREGSISV